MTRDRALLLFDLDGTLLDCGGVGMRALQRAARQLFGGALSFEGIDAAGRLDASLFAEAARRSGFNAEPEHQTQLREVYVALLEAELRAVDAVRVLPGVPGLFDQLNEQTDTITLGCVTGNYEAAAATKMRAGGLDAAIFRANAFGDESEARPDLIDLALQRYAAFHGQTIEANRVVVVGDTPHDVEAAHAHGCRVLAVATGRYSASDLADAGADRVAEDLQNPAVLWDML
jgi:phosphoglycolate phosphatase-like HAD superfamily hydrolase